MFLDVLVLRRTDGNLGCIESDTHAAQAVRSPSEAESGSAKDAGGLGEEDLQALVS